MNPTLRNTIALVGGLLIGSLVNMLLIRIGGFLIPPPEGVNVTDFESLKSSMHLLEPKNFIFPFLAHALGTLAGAFVAAKFAFSHNMKFAVTVGVVFLIGGIINSFLLPAPVWFIVLDLAAAYIPMALIGGKAAERIKFSVTKN